MQTSPEVLLSYINFFHLQLGCLMTNFKSLLRKHLDYSNINHSVKQEPCNEVGFLSLPKHPVDFRKDLM